VDRIRKALDLARLEREAQPTPEPSRPAAGLPTKITYTNTHVFTPDAGALESKRIVSPAGNDAAVAAFRMLRTQVIQRMDENGWRTLAVLSPGTKDGKTTTAINLAVSLANDRRHTVLLVDCDLRRPNIGASLGISPEFGMDDLLRGAARVDQCLYHPEGFDRLVVLPARAALANSSEALAGPLGRALVADLRGRYPERIIVFDLPPVLGTDDALAFLPLVECGLVVIAERATRRDDLLRCMELLRKTPILGTVLNKASDVDYGYG
jgi:Mrp family chromosome partitioning ATPase